VLIVVLIWALTRHGNSSAAMPAPVLQSTANSRSCSHCGAALQAGWSHCPQCGAPV
jgi:predicted amidophosphoribosyltransferase